MIWTISGGVPRSSMLGAQAPRRGDLFFMQISDSHIGFSKAANADVTETMRAAIARINAMPVQPAFLLHTGERSGYSLLHWVADGLSYRAVTDATPADLDEFRREYAPES